MRWLLIVALVGCGTSTTEDIVGPFTGPVHRYVVDRMTLPTTVTASHQFADDLDGGGPKNQLGQIASFLAAQGDANDHANDMIAAGVIGSVVEIQADDLTDDPRVGVTYHGVEGDAATVMGGAFVAGSLASNRSRTTRVPGAATVVLPIFADADPASLALDAMEIDLAPDGHGGFDAIVRGGIASASIAPALLIGIRQMLAANPGAHSSFARALDTNSDGTITDDEIVHDDLVTSLVVPDLAAEQVSAGFSVHLTPCAAGTCSTAPPADRCHDRIREADETDVDCGGASCMPCGPQRHCQVAHDCQTPACDSGLCRAASCSDGVLDGFEEQPDCGGLCSLCTGDVCSADAQCKTGTCTDHLCH